VWSVLEQKTWFDYWHVADNCVHHSDDAYGLQVHVVSDVIERRTDDIDLARDLGKDSNSA
jgi:hypothetical protein